MSGRVPEYTAVELETADAGTTILHDGQWWVLGDRAGAWRLASRVGFQVAALPAAGVVMSVSVTETEAIANLTYALGAYPIKG